MPQEGFWPRRNFALEGISLIATATTTAKTTAKATATDTATTKWHCESQMPQPQPQPQPQQNATATAKATTTPRRSQQSRPPTIRNAQGLRGLAGGQRSLNTLARRAPQLFPTPGGRCLSTIVRVAALHCMHTHMRHSLVQVCTYNTRLVLDRVALRSASSGATGRIQPKSALQ